METSTPRLLGPLDPERTDIPQARRDWSQLRKEIEHLPVGQPVELNHSSKKDREDTRMRLLHMATSLGISIRTWADRESGKLRMIRVEGEGEAKVSPQPKNGKGKGK